MFFWSYNDSLPNHQTKEFLPAFLENNPDNMQAIKLFCAKNAN